MAERDMNKYQRGVIDGCFEEGHYQRGIASLNQLRMQNLRPSAAHIRQLIYISLYPPSPSRTSGNDKGKRKEVPILTGSPSKQLQQARRLQKQALFPPPEATDAARELLLQFALDILSPEALLRAIPCYPLTQVELDNAPRQLKADLSTDRATVEDMDSYVAKQASKLKECKDCWSMLREGVVTREDAALLRMEDPFLDADPEHDIDGTDPSSTIVGKQSWYLLDWFIRLFEKDQRLSAASADTDKQSYSVLLLSQIKPPSIHGDPRSYTETILDIVFLCYSQSEEWRRDLGKRLMGLLVRLTACSNFTPMEFFKSASARLQASPSGLVTNFLSDLPITTRGLMVKLAICDRFMTQSLRSSSGTGNEGVARARPQARRARPNSIHVNGDSEAPSGSQGNLNFNQDGQSKWGLPSSQRVLQLLESSSKMRSSLTNVIVLFHLFAAFGTLRADEQKEADHLWVEALQSGDLERRVRETYTEDELGDGLPESNTKMIMTFRLLLLSKCNSWRQLLR